MDRRVLDCKHSVLSEVNKWSAKCLRKLENHTNALAVYLLDNSELNTD
jgi:hypothetical protein